MNLDSYDRLLPSQDTHTGRGMGNLIAAPMNGKRRRHGTTLFLDTATLEPYADQWAYLSSLDRLTPGTLFRLVKELPTVQFGRAVRELELPTSSKIVPRPAPVVRAQFGARITLTASDLGPAMISAVKHAASMPNPEFYDRERQRRSTWNIPRFLRSYDETLEGDLILPRGILPLLESLVQSAGSRLAIEDERSAGTNHEFECTARLSPDQTQAVEALARTERGVLVAPPGAGKTIMACTLLARRNVSTLVLVDRKALADQWRARIREFMGVTCGQIGGGRSKTTGRIDVALLPTLARRTNVKDMTAAYGFVVVDECHHVPAAAFTDAMNRIPARYWLGLTATPNRRDKLDELIYHQLGPVAHTLEAAKHGQLPRHHADLPVPQPRLEVHRTAFCYSGDADSRQPGGISRIYKALIADETRLTQVAADVITAHEQGGNILVLTTWTKHLEALVQKLHEAGLDPAVFTGGMKASARQAAIRKLAEPDDDSPLLVAGTGAYIGEGFDCPRLDTLFLAAPISFKGRLTQYVGRITRPYPGKQSATVHDYHDELTPVLAASLTKRAPGYTTMGFPDPRQG